MQLNDSNSQHKKPSSNFFMNTFIPSKDDTPAKKRNKIICICIAVLVIVAIVVGCLVFAKYSRAKNEVDKDKELYPSSTQTSSDTASEVNADVDATTSSTPAVSSEPLDPEYGVTAKFVELYKTNPDVVGWLKIDGTKLDIPVVKGSDNEYYLDHSLEKKKNAFGVPFADYRGTFNPTYQSTNVTIYGHAAKDGSFFTPVKEYNDLEFYKKHPTMTFDTIYGAGEYKIIGRFIERVDGKEKMFNYHDYVDLDEANFNKFVDNVKQRSYFDAPVDTKFGDQLITLSTCNVEIVNSLKTPYRDVLVARKVRPGESAEVDVSKAEINKDMVMPKGWQDKFKKTNPYS